ncbi:sensor histidine kinase [Bacillus alkalicellulosilyticus]|uniref:sensor histidine kinase n=1 Tax=Alkalihalobacterium alkalicellulosilyticum TaxID=1912214 RepID=UPI0009969716|nr:GHKL domain-containing protein [Bacillus alkalicellulosilyticus]
MKHNLGYWMFYLLFGAIHVFSVGTTFSHPLILYPVLFLILLFPFIWGRRKNVLFFQFPIGMIVFCLQLLYVVLYFVIGVPWGYFMPFLLFLATEVFRMVLATKLYDLYQNIKEYKSEQKQMNMTFETVRSERHDFLKHVGAIQFMIENNNFQEAKGYISELVDSYEETNLSIKGERGSVAGILHSFYKKAKKESIDISFELDLPVSSLPLSDKDIVTLLGNILSNSIEAAKEWQTQRSEKAQISLQFFKRSGLFIMVCRNNTLPIPSDILDRLFESYGRTTKGGDHQGLGSKLIHTTVKAYNGILDFVYKEEEFMIKIKIPAFR